jgi:hypothetical protein
MARQNIAALLGNAPKAEEPEMPAAPASAPEQPAAPVEAAQPTAAAKPTPPKAKKPAAKPAPAGGEPLYLTLERKETRLRGDQYAELTAHARRLNKAKGVGGERITENTLIRIAIDLLVPLLDQASGRDEAEIRESVSSGVR